MHPSSSCPTLPSDFLFLFLFVTADKTVCHTICVPFPVFTPASCLFSVLVGGDGGRGCYVTTGHSDLPFPSSAGEGLFV